MKPDSTTLVEALELSAQGDRAITYIHGMADETRVTYYELRERALGLLAYLQHHQVSPGDEMVLLVDTNEEFVDGFWACLLGGIVAVPLAIGVGDAHFRKLLGIFRQLQRPRLYATTNSLRKFEKYCKEQSLEHEFSLLCQKTVLSPVPAQCSESGQLQDVLPNQRAFIQFSSGSTGNPKGVVLSHHNVMTNIRGILNGARVRETDSSLSWMPMTHDMGIIGFHLAPVVANAPMFLMPTELFVRRPMLWLQKISEKRATLTASPNFGIKHLLKRFNSQPGELDLSCVRLVLNGAEPISASLCREFSQTLSEFGFDDRAMFPVYGLAEASLAVSFSDPETPVVSVHVERNTLALGQQVSIVSESGPNSLELVSVGRAIDGCEVMIVGDEIQPAATRYIGHILIRGDNVTAGYYADAELNRDAFLEDGWLDTGDLGFEFGGNLFIAGREKDLIILNGQNFHPHDLESLCETNGGIEQGKVVAFGLHNEEGDSEALVICVLHRGEMAGFLPTVRELRRLLNEKVGVNAEYVIPVRTIPKTTSGKIQRYKLAERFRAGEFDSAVCSIRELMTSSQADQPLVAGSVQEILLAICDSVIDDREIGADDDLFEVGTSSLKLAQIHERIEEQFPGKVEVSDLFEYPSVSRLAAVLEKRKTKEE